MTGILSEQSGRVRAMMHHLIETTKSYWKQLRDAPPGRRFREFYKFRHSKRQSGSSAGRIATIAIAIVLIVGGLAIGWLPGPGGFIAIFGVALLGQEFRPLAHLLDATETFFRSIWRWFTRSGPVIQTTIVLVLLIAAGGALYAGYELVQ